MFKNLVFVVLLVGLLVQKSLPFPHGESESKSSSEENTQQQQQQNIDAESLEEFTKQIKTKGKVEKQSVSPSISDPCLEEKRVGRCKAAIPRVFFNKAEGKCQTFIWGGCGANSNNFQDLGECEKVCAKHLPVASILPVPFEDDEEVCTLPPITSPTGGINCNGFMTRWTYNTKEGKCVQYIYGGCSASKNNFRNEQQCQATCGNFNNNRNEGENRQQPIASILPISGSGRCSLPKDAGFCYAFKERYWYNQRNNRCELFKFGGCGGNANNFKSADECVRTCGGDFPSKDAECSEVECPWELYSHYSILGCKPIYDDQSCCPTRFDCPDTPPGHNNSLAESRSLSFDNETAHNPQCHYRGTFYNIGDEMPEASDTSNCRAACICQETRSGKGKIMCAAIECPENFGSIPEDKVNCLPVYKRGGCCAYDYYCHNDTLTIIKPGQETPESAFKCTVDGESYFEGQRFYPKKEKCLKCICSKGFKGDLTDEFCETVDCGLEIYYSEYLERGCAPVYYQSADGTSSCCPYSWECPDETQDQVPVKATTTIRPPVTSGVGPIPVTERPLVVPVVEENTPQSRNKALLLTQEACAQPKQVGPCKGLRPRYFYNNETKKCEEFFFSGCLGNANNFVSILDCQKLCVTDAAESPDKTLLSRTLDVNRQQTQAASPRAIYVSEMDPCTMPQKTGVCKGFFHRYAYSPQDNACHLFIYGGCRGNANNFYSQESCEATCIRASINAQDIRVSVPTLFRGKSLGDSTMVRFGEDNVPLTRSNSPVSQTNPSRIQDTVSHHLERCLIPKKSGSCLQVIPAYFYDVETNTCNFFVYSGCLGNANRFASLDECENQCKKSAPSENQGIGGRMRGLPWRQNKLAVVSPGDDSTSGSGLAQSGTLRNTTRPLPTPEEAKEICKLPPVSGPCRAHILRFHWDFSTAQCLPFVYGCRGNRNNFVSESDCLSVCRQQPTIENLTSNGILSCTFGNETLPLGSTVRRFKQNKKWNPQTQEDEGAACGVTICQCVTPPSVTCFQTACPTPSTTQSKVCATPSCSANCKEAIGLDGCPTCDCDETESQVQVQEIFVKENLKG